MSNPFRRGGDSLMAHSPLSRPLSTPSARQIEHCRAEIDHVDRVLVRLLNLRARLALKVAGLKRGAGLPLHAPGREREVLRNVTEANPGPLDRAAVAKLFRLAIRESRRLEENDKGGGRSART